MVKRFKSIASHPWPHPLSLPIFSLCWVLPGFQGLEEQTVYHPLENKLRANTYQLRSFHQANGNPVTDWQISISERLCSYAQKLWGTWKLHQNMLPVISKTLPGRKLSVIKSPNDIPGHPLVDTHWKLCPWTWLQKNIYIQVVTKYFANRLM